MSYYKTDRVNRLWVFCVVILIFFAVVSILKVVLSGGHPFGYMKKDVHVCSSLGEIAEELTVDLKGKQEGTITLYVKEVPIQEIRYVNYYMNTIDGTVKNFVSHHPVMGVRQIDFEVERSDNSYVLDAYLNNNPIPSDRPRAQYLYKKVCVILDSILSENMSVYNKELLIHDYLVEHCVFDSGSDENDNKFRAYGALVEGKAVCNGYAEAMSLLLSCAGIENAYVVGYVDNSSLAITNSNEILLEKTDASEEMKEKVKQNHAWNQVCINNKWYNVDATWDDPVGVSEVTSHRYFNVSDEILSRDHSWKQEGYHSCVDMDWNYFVKNNQYVTAQDILPKSFIQLATGHPYGYVELAFSCDPPTEDELSGIFQIPGVQALSYGVTGKADYKILGIFIN